MLASSTRSLTALCNHRLVPSSFSVLRNVHNSPPMIVPTSQSGFGFVSANPLPAKPRVTSSGTRGATEIRGPYYNAAFGPAILRDTLAITHPWVDGLKFAGGGFALIPEKALREMIDVAHEHDVYVSTGGWVERILATSNDRTRDVEKYITRCKDLGFDTIEISTGFISLPVTDWAEIVQLVNKAGLKAKPELGIQWGAGGDAEVSELESAGTSDVGGLIDAGKQLIDAGANILMIESEGITENVRSWRTDVLSQIIRHLPLDRLMFEAADPKVFEWYIQNHGVDINLFVDHSQAIQLACLRAGIWGTNKTFGRVVNFRNWSKP